MRSPGTSSIRCLLVTFAAVIAAPQMQGAEAVSADVQITSHKAPGGAEYFALAIRPSTLESDAVRRHIVIVDTSASQVGTVRESSLLLVSEVLNSLPETNTVSVFAVDVECESLTSDFLPVRSAGVADAVRSLEMRTPLGSTDLAAALQEVCRVADSAHPTSVLYIGDGLSANRIPADALTLIVEELNSRQVSLHSLVLGARTNLDLPSILANLTGGTVGRVTRGDEVAVAATAASELSKASIQVKRLETDGHELVIAGRQVLYIRPDRHTVVFGEGTVPQFGQLTAVTVDDSKINWKRADSQRLAGGAELRHLVEALQTTSGINAPIADLQGLKAAELDFAAAMDKSLRAARLLGRKGQVRQAREILDAAAHMDASNPKLRLMLASMKQPPVAVADPDTATVLPPPAAVNPGADGFGGGQGSQTDPLSEVAARVKLQTQILLAETNAAIDDARRSSADDPVYATNLLKDVLETIQSSADISPDVRSELERRVISAIGEVRSRVEQNALQQKQIARDEAVTKAQERLLEEQDIEEKRLAIQIEKVRGLLDRGRHGDVNAFEDAEFESRITLDLKPGSGPATQALVMSEALGQLDKAYRLINLRHDRFLEVMYQVELSHVPFPDEPPITYPPADVWRALTLTRKPRYESFDLRSEAPVEKWLRQMLDKPVRNLDFPGDTPLSEILETIETYFTATYGAGVGASGTDFKMTIYPDSGELNLEGIDSLEDVTISDISFDGMTLRNALKLIFDQTNDDTKAPVPLTYVIQNEVMMITTKDKAESEDNLVTRVYPVADLVIPPNAHLQLGGGGGGGGGGFGGQGGGGGFGGQGGGGGFGGQGGGGGFGGQGGGGGFMSIPPEVAQMLNDSDDNGITTDDLNAVKKKPVLK